VRGAEELRVKESDRIAALVDGLTALGADIEGRRDGFTVRGPTRWRGGRADARGDHRIAMSMAVAAMAIDGDVTIEGWDSVAISYPGFGDELLACG
jgi:3-phosphoshikimate 1-carboxyvinyltransferase